MHPLRPFAMPALGVAILALAAPAASAATTQKVKLKFAAVAGDAPVACGTPIPGLGSGSTTAELQDLRFFVSEVRLLKRNGSSVRVNVRANKEFRIGGTSGVSLIDLEDATGACRGQGTPATNSVIVCTVPKGTYTGVRYSIGVPFKLNHTDTVGADAPLNSAAMAWSWQSGRKFTKIEVVDPAGAAGSWKAKAFFIHLGSTGCTGNPATGQTVACKSANRATVKLRQFDPSEQNIALDVRSLLAGTDITANQAGAPGCMSGPTDPECASVFSAFGIGWKADGTGSGKPLSTQSAFLAIDR